MATAVFKAGIIIDAANETIEAIERRKERAIDAAITRAMEPHLTGRWYKRRLVKRTRGEAEAHITAYRGYLGSEYDDITRVFDRKIYPWAKLREAALGAFENGNGQVTLDHEEIALLRSATANKDPA